MAWDYLQPGSGPALWLWGTHTAKRLSKVDQSHSVWILLCDRAWFSVLKSAVCLVLVAACSSGHTGVCSTGFWERTGDTASWRKHVLDVVPVCLWQHGCVHVWHIHGIYFTWQPGNQLMGVIWGSKTWGDWTKVLNVTFWAGQSDST